MNDTILLGILIALPSILLAALFTFVYIAHRQARAQLDNIRLVIDDLHQLRLGIKHQVREMNQAIPPRLTSIDTTIDKLHQATTSLNSNQLATNKHLDAITARLEDILEVNTMAFNSQREIMDNLTPSQQDIPYPQPAAPTSYSELDPDAPVTWAQVRAAAEERRQREAARQHAETQPEATLDQQPALSRQPDTPSNPQQNDQSSEDTNVSSFDEILRLAEARKENRE